MSELFIKQELIKLLPQLDALILDIDGVVLDVSGSFRVVICETTQLYATNWLHLEGDEPLLRPSETELFKLAGGFNSDWDLTNAAVALAVAKVARWGGTKTSELREQKPSLEVYTQEIKRRGGGPAAAESFLLEMLTPSQRRDFARAYNPKLVTQLFQEMYAGEAACRDLYGFSPEHLHGDGFYQNEVPILDSQLLQSFKKLQIGILTGRTRAETRLALQLANLQIPETSWVTEDDGVRKPDGKTLILLRERMEFKTAVFIGDTLDDLNAVHNYRELKGAGRARVFSCIALSGPAQDAHRRLFLEAGAEIVAPDANSFLQYLKAVLK